jgi:hypothetical protein
VKILAISKANVASTAALAYRNALRCDPVSAFGGVVASNTSVDATLALEIAKIFTEVVVAPSFEAEALDPSRAVFSPKPVTPTISREMTRGIGPWFLAKQQVALCWRIWNLHGVVYEAFAVMPSSSLKRWLR